ncbi:hypothetical protein [Xenorhabdus stockiae]|uniref:hypothetical protein n=1 Tax=Xenorhabdus stockiae TaxID=351614 RepID=UPI004063C317
MNAAYFFKQVVNFTQLTAHVTLETENFVQQTETIPPHSQRDFEFSIRPNIKKVIINLVPRPYQHPNEYKLNLLYIISKKTQPLII